MPLIQDSHDSLPHIDPEITPQKRSEIDALLTAELPPNHATTLHPLLPSSPSCTFSPLLTAELDDRASHSHSPRRLTAIDTTRYETLEPPSPPSLTSSDQTRPALVAAWTATLRQAYTSTAHLDHRLQNLALLEQFGKNAWLVGNAQLETMLTGVEKELVETREEREVVEKRRREVQDGVRGEMEGLEEGWRKGVGRLVEVEVGAEGVRREILERRRGGRR